MYRRLPVWNFSRNKLTIVGISAISVYILKNEGKTEWERTREYLLFFFYLTSQKYQCAW